MVPVAQDTKPVSFEDLGTMRIALCRMLPTIEFYQNVAIEAGEVSNEAGHEVLSTKLEPSEFPVAPG